MCTDPAVVAANVAVKVASGDPDYDGQEPSQAEKDFRERIKHYEDSYQPLDEVLDKDVTYCKMVNVGKQVSTNPRIHEIRADDNVSCPGDGQSHRRLPAI